MKLYHNPISPNGRKVTATLAILGLDIEQEVIDLRSGAQRTPEFLGMNPNGKVPVLVDGDFTLWESNAICQYLCETAGNTDLWPADIAGRADVSRWMSWQLAHFGPAAHQLVVQNLMVPMRGGTPDPELVKEGEVAFNEVAAVINNELEGKQWLVGDHLTLADVVCGAVMTYATHAKFPLDAYPHLRMWNDRLNGVAAWSGTAPQF